MIVSKKLFAHLNIHRQVSVIACTIATVILGVEFSLTGQSADAQVAALNCVGTENVSYSPPLTLNPKPTNININGQFQICNGDAQIIGGYYSNIIQSPNSSCVQLTSSPANFTYFWSDGTTSIVSFGTEVVTGGASVINVTSPGYVISGRYQGSQVVKTLTLVASQLTGCVTTGVAQSSGLVTLTFAHL
ncbi:hypothetical protein H6G93_18100 [Nostoc sp. FACHB-973]|nr:hypothetical protein [Nostoc sp. FACHB-973]